MLVYIIIILHLTSLTKEFQPIQYDLALRYHAPSPHRDHALHHDQVVCNMCAKVIFEVIASFDISQSYYYYLFCSACNVLSFYVNDFAKWTESNAVLYIRCE